MAYCNQEIINRLNEAGFNTGQKTIKQGELNDIIEEVLNDWIDDITITTQKRLELINTIVEAKDKYQQCYFYWWACEEVYTYREVYKGDVYLQVISLSNIIVLKVVNDISKMMMQEFVFIE